jgi:hypothetical protein
MTSPFLSSKVEHGILTFSFTRPDKSNNYDAAVNAMTRRLAREPISPAVLDELQRAFLFAADSAEAEAAPRLAPRLHRGGPTHSAHAAWIDRSRMVGFSPLSGFPGSQP